MNGSRIVVISDTHGRFHALYDIVEKHQKEAACFIHLGDGEKEVDDITSLFPDLTFYHVRGNCDFVSQAPYIQSIEIAGKIITFTHGHTYYVKQGLYHLKSTARNLHTDIILYGHTHQSYTEYDDGLYILNPGSPVQPRNGSPSYGIIDITSAGIVLNIVKL